MAEHASEGGSDLKKRVVAAAESIRSWYDSSLECHWPLEICEIDYPDPAPWGFGTEPVFWIHHGYSSFEYYIEYEKKEMVRGRYRMFHPFGLHPGEHEGNLLFDGTAKYSEWFQFDCNSIVSGEANLFDDLRPYLLTFIALVEEKLLEATKEDPGNWSQLNIAELLSSGECKCSLL